MAGSRPTMTMSSSEYPRLADGECAGRQRDVQPVKLARLQTWQFLCRLQEAVRLPGRDDAVSQRGELADVVVAAKRSGAERMGVGHSDLIDDPTAVLHH